MERVIKIGNKELKLRSSLLTIIIYKNTFGTDLFNDIQKLDVTQTKDGNMTNAILVLFQIIYSLHKPYINEGFEDFLNQFDFNVISDVSTLEDISNVIGELLANGNGNTSSPQNP